MMNFDQQFFKLLSKTTHMLVMIDDFTGFKYVDFPDKKVLIAVSKCLAKLIALVKNFWGYHLRFLVTDKTTDFIGKDA